MLGHQSLGFAEVTLQHVDFVGSYDELGSGEGRCCWTHSEQLVVSPEI